MALVHDNIDLTKPEFFIGSSLPDIGTGVYSYTIAGTGLENRDFSQITADGNTYVFRNLQSASGKMLLVRMPDANTVRVEVQADTAGPWNVTGNYVEFVR